MRWILSLFVVLMLTVPAMAQPKLEFLPICERAPEGWPGKCLLGSFVDRKEFTAFANYIARRVPFACDFGVIDPEKPATRDNLVLLSCPPMTLSGPVDVE